MTLAQRLAVLLEGPPRSEAEERHRVVIRRQIERIESKCVRCNGWKDFRPPLTQDLRNGGSEA